MLGMPIVAVHLFSDTATHLEMVVKYLHHATHSLLCMYSCCCLDYFPGDCESCTTSSGTYSKQSSSQLHPSSQDSSAPLAPSLLHLPPEVLLNILSYLSPCELLSLSHLHSKLNTLAFDGSLWQHIHPVRWAQGHREFYQPLVSWGNVDSEEGAYHDAVLENDVIKELLSDGGKVNANSAKFR